MTPEGNQSARLSWLGKTVADAIATSTAETDLAA